MYDGKIMKGLELPRNLNWGGVSLIFIDSDVQPCGHVILRVAPYNFHFNGPNFLEYPKMLTDSELTAYIQGRNRKVMFTYTVEVPRPEKAATELRLLMNNKWQTWVMAHNCATFAKSVLKAGGANLTYLEYCPLINQAAPNELIKWFKEQR